MTKPISIEQLQNASRDADTLAEVINGDENTDVTSRLGATYPTLDKALKMMFKNGMLGMTPFDSKTALDADTTLAEGEYAIVLNDTSEKNGLYKKESGIFVKKSYNDGVGELTKNLMSLNRENLVEFADSNDSVYMFVDESGRLHLTDIDTDVQTLLNQAQSTSEQLGAMADTVGDNGYALMLLDNQEQLIFGVKNNGQLVTKNKEPLSVKRPPFVVLDIAYPSHVLHQCVAPVPLSQVPMAFDVPSDIINLTVTQPAKNTPIDTMYRIDDGVVHPHILDFYSGFNGYQYWLGLTPYYADQDQYENPFIYVSNDLQAFDVNTDFAQPLDDTPQRMLDARGYNSDIFFTYDHQSGELLACWRTSYRGNNYNANQIWARRTRDGKNWSSKELIYTAKDGESVLSPSIVYDFTTKKYLMFCVDAVSRGVYGISRMESDSIDGEWTNKTFVSYKSGITPWHLEVRYIGRQLCCIINDHTDTKNLYIGISRDMGKSFTVGNKVLTGSHHEPYKATMQPIFDGKRMCLHVMWTSNHTPTDDNEDWNLYGAKTDYVNIAGV